MHPLAWLVLGGLGAYLVLRPSDSGGADSAPSVGLVIPRPLPRQLTDNQRRELARILQTQLTALRLYTGPVDGVPNAETRAAIDQYLARNYTTLDHVLSLGPAALDGDIVSYWIDDAYRAAMGYAQAVVPTPLPLSAALIR